MGAWCNLCNGYDGNYVNQVEHPCRAKRIGITTACNVPIQKRIVHVNYRDKKEDECPGFEHDWEREEAFHPDVTWEDIERSPYEQRRFWDKVYVLEKSVGHSLDGYEYDQVLSMTRELSEPKERYPVDWIKPMLQNVPQVRRRVEAKEYDATPMSDTGLAAATLGWPIPTEPLYERYTPLRAPQTWYRPSIPHQY